MIEEDATAGVDVVLELLLLRGGEPVGALRRLGMGIAGAIIIHILTPLAAHDDEVEGIELVPRDIVVDDDNRLPALFSQPGYQDVVQRGDPVAAIAEDGEHAFFVGILGRGGVDQEKSQEKSQQKEPSAGECTLFDHTYLSNRWWSGCAQ